MANSFCSIAARKAGGSLSTLRAMVSTVCCSFADSDSWGFSTPGFCCCWQGFSAAELLAATATLEPAAFRARVVAPAGQQQQQQQEQQIHGLACSPV